MNENENWLRTAVRRILLEAELVGPPPGEPTDIPQDAIETASHSVSFPGRMDQLGPVKDVFIHLEQGGMMVPTKSLIRAHLRDMNEYKTTKDKARKEYLSRHFLFSKDNFRRLNLGYEILSKTCSEADLTIAFDAFNKEVSPETFVRLDHVFNEVGASKGIPPSFLKAMCLKESLLGTKPTPGYSPRFSIGKGIFSDLKAWDKEYVPTFEDINRSPYTEAKVAATLLTKFIPMLKKTNDIDVIFDRYRSGSEEPDYLARIISLQKVIEGMQLSTP